MTHVLMNQTATLQQSLHIPKSHADFHQNLKDNPTLQKCTNKHFMFSQMFRLNIYKLHQWPLQEAIHWRYLPYISPMLQAYVSGNIPTKYGLTYKVPILGSWRSPIDRI